MKITLAQMKVVDDIETNLKKAISFMEKASNKEVDIICFPEVQFSPFFPQYKNKNALRYAMSMDHEAIKSLQLKCKELCIAAFPNIYLQEGNKYYDATPVINSKGKILGISKMVHIVQLPLFYEQDYYSPSDTGFKVYDTPFGKIGVVICFDRHFPESIRSCVLQGAKLIVIPTAIIKSEPLEMFEWEMRVTAMQNNVFIAMCNRVGIEDQMDFAGMSLVVDPNGDVVVKADDAERLLIADINLKLVEESRRNKPFLKLRRPETYL